MVRTVTGTKAIPADGDLLFLQDAADGNQLKTIDFADIGISAVTFLSTLSGTDTYGMYSDAAQTNLVGTFDVINGTDGTGISLAAYSAAQTYAVTEVAHVDGKLWRSLVGGNLGNTPGTDNTNWAPFNATSFVGVWQAAEFYELGQMVMYLDEPFRAIVTTGNQAQNPRTSPLFWTRVRSKVQRQQWRWDETMTHFTSSSDIYGSGTNHYLVTGRIETFPRTVSVPSTQLYLDTDLDMSVVPTLASLDIDLQPTASAIRLLELTMPGKYSYRLTTNYDAPRSSSRRFFQIMMNVPRGLGLASHLNNSSEGALAGRNSIVIDILLTPEWLLANGGVYNLSPAAHFNKYVPASAVTFQHTLEFEPL